jgi:hypothetical protein
MSKSTHREPVQAAQSAVEDDHAAGLTRRTVLAGVAATTAVATVGVDTGIPAGKLAPATDSIGIKHDYFKWVNEREPAAFASLMKIAKDNANSSQAMIEKSQATDDTKFLARSIVLMWYLGSWYAPADLKKLVDSKSSPSPLFIPHTVISPKAYTQGWVWRVAQAHPMGYSDLQFGYWTRDPAPLEDFITLGTKGKGT